MKTLAFLAALLFALAGCATLTEKECRVVDWAELGRADGAIGRPASHVAAHQSACAASGAAPDVAAYEAGRRDGLQLYCTPEGVYRAARRGRLYEGVCAETSAAFQTAYERGRAYRSIRRRINDLEARLYDYPFPLGPLRPGHGPFGYGHGFGFDDFAIELEIDRLERRLNTLEGPYPTP